MLYLRMFQVLLDQGKRVGLSPVRSAVAGNLWIVEKSPGSSCTGGTGHRGRRPAQI